MYKRRIFTRRNQQRSFRLPVGLLFVLLAIALCVFIPANRINMSNLNVTDPALPTPLPTFTPLPRPTKEHIGRLIFTCTRGDFNQLYFPGFGNPQLRPERARNTDLGVTWAAGGHEVRLVRFDNRVRDLIVNVSTPSGLLQPENVQRARIDGWTLGYTGRLGATTLRADLELLATAAGLPGLLTAVVSGRPRSDLERWFGATPGLWLVAEHGAFFRGDGAWITTFAGSGERLADLQSSLERIASLTPGALVERKSWTLALHYREVSRSLAPSLLVEVEAAVRSWLESNPGFEYFQGAAVIEVRPTGARKTVAVDWVRRARGAETHIVAIGDDVTDEDMFLAMGSTDEAVLVAGRVDR